MTRGHARGGEVARPGEDDDGVCGMLQRYGHVRARQREPRWSVVRRAQRWVAGPRGGSGKARRAATGSRGVERSTGAHSVGETRERGGEAEAEGLTGGA